MTLTLETGEGVTDANAYADRTYADTYFSTRGVTTWTGTNAAKDAALIKATDYMDNRWGALLVGRREFDSDTNELLWPRLGVYDRDGVLIEGIPDRLARACCEYALRALSAELMPDPGVSDSGIVTSTRQKVGPIEEETKYAEGTTAALTQNYPVADRLMAPFVTAAGRVDR